MNVLGDSLEKIAFEKAGIIKKNIPGNACNNNYVCARTDGRANVVVIEPAGDCRPTIVDCRRLTIHSGPFAAQNFDH